MELKRAYSNEEKPKAVPNRKKYSPKRWVVYRENKLLA